MRTLTYTCLVFLLSLFSNQMCAQYGPGTWTVLGGTNTDAPPYDLLYYKVAEVKSSTDRYASIIDISVQANADYFSVQGTYRIRIDKYENTSNRFDGLQINCMSGNPGAATFYVFDNALWVRSNAQWGMIFYREEGKFANGSPLTLGTWHSTVQAPVGYLKATTDHGLACDFDNNHMFEQPYTSMDGIVYVANKIGIGVPDAQNKLVLPNAQFIAWKSPGSSVEDVGIVTNASNDLSFYVHGPDKIYIKNATGNVGIGTSNPGDYKLAVAGTIGAQKVKVTSVGWSDFVFEDQYRLMPLAEVEQFIQHNKHLPGIPAAKEVERKGIELGEMNSKLLQKIEELTLYLIEHRKEMDALKAENTGLREDVTRLKQVTANTFRRPLPHPKNPPVIK